MRLEIISYGNEYDDSQQLPNLTIAFLPTEQYHPLRIIITLNVYLTLAEI